MRLLPCIVALALLAGCNRDYFSGELDLARVEKGETYAQQISLPFCGRMMIRVVEVVDAPPWRVLNVQRDIESYPLWQSGFESGKVLARDGDNIDAEFALSPVAFHSLSPMREHIHIDAEHLQTSFTGYENDWMRDNQIVVKLSPLGDGNRTLVNFYFQGEIKLHGVSFLSKWNEERMAHTAENLKRMVQLQQYGTHEEAPQKAVRTRVAIPAFGADGVAPDEARTLTRVFAEQMMRNGAWDVSTPQEIAAMLTYNRQETLLGCETTGKCGVDLGKAVGADRIVVGSIGKVGGQLVVSASLIRVPEGLIDKRVSQNSAEASVIDTVRTVADQIGRP